MLDRAKPALSSKPAWTVDMSIGRKEALNQFSPVADYGKQSVDPEANYLRGFPHGTQQAGRGCLMGRIFAHASRAASPVTTLSPPGVVF